MSRYTVNIEDKQLAVKVNKQELKKLKELIHKAKTFDPIGLNIFITKDRTEEVLDLNTLHETIKNSMLEKLKRTKYNINESKVLKYLEAKRTF